MWKRASTLQHSAICPALWLKGGTVSETAETSRDVARQLIESCQNGDPLPKNLRPMHKAGMDLTIPEVA